MSNSLPFSLPYVPRLSGPGDPPVVAVVLEGDTIVDECWGWETAQNFALNSDGVRVVAVADETMVNGDGETIVVMSRERIQAVCDYNADLRADCFG